MVVMWAMTVGNEDDPELRCSRIPHTLPVLTQVPYVLYLPPAPTAQTNTVLQLYLYIPAIINIPFPTIERLPTME